LPRNAKKTLAPRSSAPWSGSTRQLLGRALRQPVSAAPVLAVQVGRGQVALRIVLHHVRRGHFKERAIGHDHARAARMGAGGPRTMVRFARGANAGRVGHGKHGTHGGWLVRPLAKPRIQLRGFAVQRQRSGHRACGSSARRLDRRAGLPYRSQCSLQCLHLPTLLPVPCAASRASEKVGNGPCHLPFLSLGSG